MLGCQLRAAAGKLSCFTSVALVVRQPSNTQSRLLHVARTRKSCQDDDRFKDDPDVMGILSGIKKDFDKSKAHPNKPDNSPVKEGEPKADNNKEKSGGEDEKSGTAPVKDITQLLAEIYGSGDKGSSSSLHSVGGYTEYKDEDSQIIFDVDEERDLIRKAIKEGRDVEDDRRKKPQPGHKYAATNRGRGSRGVFEIEELVDILRQEKVADVVVIRIPPEKQYCDYMVIATGRNIRHISVVSSVLLSVFKMKMSSTDKVPSREGGANPSCGWIAMDMGNIALHLFDQEQREHYDLESLWSVGPQFDDISRALAKTETTVDALERLMQVPDLEIDHETTPVNPQDTSYKEFMKTGYSPHLKP